MSTDLSACFDLIAQTRPLRIQRRLKSNDNELLGEQTELRINSGEQEQDEESNANLGDTRK